jgi:hypothetical protein
MGRCSDGKEPVMNLVPLSGGGVLTVYVGNPPYKNTARTSLALGDSDYGEFIQVAVQTEGMVALEFKIPALVSPHRK